MISRLCHQYCRDLPTSGTKGVFHTWVVFQESESIVSPHYTTSLSESITEVTKLGLELEVEDDPAHKVSFPCKNTYEKLEL